MTIQGGRVVVTVEGRDIGLTSLIQRVQAQMQAGIATSRQYSTAIENIKPDEARLLSFAQAQARAAQQSGDFTGAINILSNALAQVSPNTTQAQNAISQLQGVLNAQEAAARKSTVTFESFTNTMFRMAGTVAVIQRIASAIGELISQGNELEKTQATFRALSGSQEAYEKNLGTAREQQSKFGGSLNDNIEGLSNFANLSKRTGIELDKLANLARAMAIIDPAQGFKGAGIALKEFFSGDISSLARRFELPRDALNQIKGINDEVEKFNKLQEVLATYGISTDLLNAQLNTTAVTFDKLSGSVSDFAALAGQALGTLLAPAASGLTNIITQWTETFQQAGKDFQAIGIGNTAQLNTMSASFLASTTTLQGFNAKVVEANANLPIFSGQIQQLTPAQYAFAQNLLQIGIGFDEVIARIQSIQPAMDRINQTLQLSGVASRVGADAMNQWQQAVYAASTVSEGGAAYAQQLAIAVSRGSISFSDATTYLINYTNAIQNGANAAREQEAATAAVINVTSLFTSELMSNATEAVNSSIATDALKFAQEQLYNAALGAASGLTGTASQAAALAAQFSITTQEAYNLISALRQLNFAREVDTFGAAGKAPSGVQNQMFNRGAAVEAAGYRRELEKIEKIERAGEYARADAAKRVKLAQQDLDRLKKGTAEYAEAQQKLLSAEKQLADQQERDAKKGKKKGGAKGAKLSDQEKLNNQLLAQQDKFQNKFEDAELKHTRNIEKIYVDHYKKLAVQQAENETGKRRSRVDFYNSLKDAEGVDTGAFAAQYEQAFSEAQAIAQQGNAKLADEYLKLRQQQINELLELEKERAAIVADEDLTAQQKQAQLDYLEGRKKLIEDAQKEERDQLVAGGDAINKDLEERLAAEEQAYAEQTDKIGTQAERAADAKITAAQRAKKAVSDENVELAKQLGYMEQITTASNGTGTKPAGSSTPVTPTTIATEQVLSVFDSNLVTSVNDQTVRLEGKMQQIIDAVIASSQDLGSRVDMLRGALNTRSSDLVRP